MAAATLPLEKISAETLQLWADRNDRRKELEREARQLGKANELLEAQILESLLEADRSHFRRGAFAVQLVDGTPRVSWKDEFVRLAGPDAAAELVKGADVPKKLQITKV